jgi:hypothetical protein
MNVARYIIRGSKNLNILALGYEYNYTGYKMPSWVPEWADCPNGTIFSSRWGRQWSAGGLSFQNAGFLEEGEVPCTDAMILGEIYSSVETVKIISTETATNVIRNLVDFVLSDLAKSYSDKQTKAESIEAAIAIIYKLYKLLFGSLDLKEELDRTWLWAVFAEFGQRIGALHDNDTIRISLEQYNIIGYAV